MSNKAVLLAQQLAAKKIKESDIPKSILNEVLEKTEQLEEAEK